jgi:hypothetical protein
VSLVGPAKLWLVEIGAARSRGVMSGVERVVVCGRGYVSQRRWVVGEGEKSGWEGLGYKSKKGKTRRLLPGMCIGQFDDCSEVIWEAPGPYLCLLAVVAIWAFSLGQKNRFFPSKSRSHKPPLTLVTLSPRTLTLQCTLSTLHIGASITGTFTRMYCSYSIVLARNTVPLE